MSDKHDYGRFISDGSDIKRISSCPFCRYKNAGANTCKAFPGGIPAKILSGEDSHNKPFPGDNGIQFGPKVPA